MHSDLTNSVFLVDAYSDPVCLKINGRASYLNCAPLNDFFKNLIKKQKLHFIVDFGNCNGVDSTFLGLIAGIALELKKTGLEGSITLYNLESRNLEVVKNLGLHRILNINPKANKPKQSSTKKNQESLPIPEEEGHSNAQEMLDAHQNLIDIDSDNLNKFQDVISYLKKQVSKEVDSSS